MLVLSSWFNFRICFSSTRLASSWAVIWIGSIIESFSTTWTFILGDFEPSFWICSNLFSNSLLSFWIFLDVSSCDFSWSFNFLICSFRSWLWLLRWQFSSCFSSNFPLMSSFFCWSSFIYCWRWHTSDSWHSNFFWICAISLSLSLRILFKHVISALFSLNFFLISWFCNLWLKLFSFLNSSICADCQIFSFLYFNRYLQIDNRYLQICTVLLITH